MGILEEEKFRKAMQIASACARERFVIPEEVLEDADKILKKTKEEAISYPRDMVLPLFGRPKEDDTQDSSITFCLNEKIRNDPDLREYGIQIGYKTSGDERRIVFKRIDWSEWERRKKDREK